MATVHERIRSQLDGELAALKEQLKGLDAEIAEKTALRDEIAAEHDATKRMIDHHRKGTA